MLYFHIGMIVAGLFMVGVGMSAVHYRTGLQQKLGAVCMPLGLVISLLGVLLSCVPGFFTFE